jgi:hypothetical protein
MLCCLGLFDLACEFLGRWDSSRHLPIRLLEDLHRHSYDANDAYKTKSLTPNSMSHSHFPDLSIDFLADKRIFCSFHWQLAYTSMFVHSSIIRMLNLLKFFN